MVKIRKINPVEILTAGMILFAVIDIIGNVPIIISLREKSSHIQSGKASVISCTIMIGFLFLGEEILNLIDIDINSFAVAGAFIFFFKAIKMVLGMNLYKEDDRVQQLLRLSPLTFPMIAGAGTMASLLSLRAEFEVINIVITIIINIVFAYIILKSSKKIKSVLGSSGISIIHKVFAVILLAIAVKIFTTNIRQMLI